jgi:NAD+ diphosphatase
MSSPSFITHAFAGNPLDRASARRSDPEWLRALLDAPASRAIVLWNGKPLLLPGPALAYVPAALAAELGELNERLLFMGLERDEREGEAALFALDMDGEADPAQGPLAGLGEFSDLRTAAQTMPIPDTGLLATAKSLLEWRRRHRYCSACGNPSNGVDGGWKRICPRCKAEHFPRTDPCVIMLPVFGDRCLVGRQAAWVVNRFSALAGFVEPGESVEEACAREVEEEAGLTVTAVRYHSSQPWPYPSNLMLGLIAEVSDDKATPDQTELESVRWLTKTEALDLVEGRADGMTAPPASAIAYHLIRDWAVS